jgi:hypothetical protein
MSAQQKNSFIDIVEVDDNVEKLQEETFWNSGDYTIPIYFKGGKNFVALPKDSEAHSKYNGSNDSKGKEYQGADYEVLELTTDMLKAYLGWGNDALSWKRHYMLSYKGEYYGEIRIFSDLQNNFLNSIIDSYYDENPDEANARWKTFNDINSDITCEEVETREALIQEFMNSWAEQHQDVVWKAFDEHEFLSGDSIPSWGAEEWKENHPRQN